MNPIEIWQVDVNGQVYETSFQELTQWIDEGSLLRGDKVRRGNLRWLEAGKIPSLFGFFNAKELGQPMPQIQFSTTESETITKNAPPQAADFAATQNFSPNQTNYSPVNNFTIKENLPPTGNFNPPPQNEPEFYQPQFEAQMPNLNVCAVHNDAEPHYICETCTNLFCKACPKGYGGSVKICPMCGALCNPLEKFHQQQIHSYQFQHDTSEGFGFSDFGRALAYPFKYKTSLVIGAVLFMLFTLGQSASAVGSMFMGAASIFCFMLANMLTFGILANTVENFSQGKIGGNFMPNFDDFSLWDDIVHPFFLSVGVYIVSFGLFIAIIIGGVWYTFKSFTNTGNEVLINKSKQIGDAKKEGRITDNGEIVLKNNELTREQQQALEDGNIEEMQRLIQEHRKKELESVVGKSPETQQAETESFNKNLISFGGIFLLFAGLAFLWGIFYLPIACTVAGYTRSFVATINPAVGLETIKLLGLDYLKIWLMGFSIIIFIGVVGAILGVIFSSFDLPGIGNLPVKAISGIFTFYFSVVFSCIIGYALYKNSAKMNLFRS